MQQKDQLIHRSSFLRNRQHLQRRPFDRQDLVDDFVEKSSLHGVLELGTAKLLCLKIFWWIALLGGVSASIYGCYAIIYSYLISPVVVSYVINESRNLPLPDVVVCPFNRLNSTFLVEQKISAELASFIEMAFGFVGIPYEFQGGGTPPNLTSPKNLKNIKALDTLLFKLNVTFSELIQMGSLSCNGLISYCVKSTGRYDCCVNATSMMTSVGKCYLLQGYPQRAAGYGYGLTMMINLPRSQYTPAINNLHNDGIAVKLVERGKGFDYDLTFVPSGVHALMPLRATRFSFIDNPPDYQCLKLTADLQNYSRLSCFDNCMFEVGHNLCGCSHVAGLNLKYPACSTTQFYNCLIPYTQTEFLRNPNIDYFCYERCKPLCQYWQYSNSLSFANFPSNTIRQFLANDEEFEKLKNSIILDIFYEKLEYTLIQHHPSMTVDTFIANLGGQLGLWVGGSILTLLQLVVFVIQFIFGVHSTPRSWRRNNDDNNQSPSDGIPLPDVATNQRFPNYEYTNTTRTQFNDTSQYDLQEPLDSSNHTQPHNI